jgi:AcrR family transcriptional regulator
MKQTSQRGRRSAKSTPAGNTLLSIAPEHLPTEVPPPPETEFRVRAAFARRQRMRNRLLLAALRVYQSRSDTAPVVIEDVVREAGVSRGTFYKYFDSIDQVAGELGTCMARDQLEIIAEIFARVPQALERVAGGALVPLVRAAMQRNWAELTSRVDYTQKRSRIYLLQGFALESLSSAHAQGALKFSSTEAALDLLIGTMIETMRRCASGEAVGQAHILNVLSMMLVGLGASYSSAARCTARVWSRLESQATTFPWWRPLAQ